MWPNEQTKMAEAIAAPTQAVPSDIIADAARFNVYRNNVAVGLIEVLKGAYPVVEALVGDAFFRQLARDFSRAHPPRTPVMNDYGAGFGDFIAEDKAASQLPYLADIAQLEWAWTRAYHAADANPISLAALAEIPDNEMDEVQLSLHPSLALLTSDWPIVSIWHAHQDGRAQAGALAELAMRPETALVLRPGLTVEIRALQPDAATLLRSLMDGETLGAAFSNDSLPAGFDAATHLTALFETGAVIGTAYSENRN